MNANEMIRKYRLQLSSDEKGIVLNGLVKVSESEVSEIRAKKPEIIAVLKQMVMERVAAAKTRQAEIEKEYVNLLSSKLPERKIVSGSDPKKRDELLEQAKSIRFFHGEEDEGLNLHASATQEKLYREAEKNCPHELKTEYVCGITSLGKKMLTRRISCEHCGLVVEDQAQEELTEKERCEYAMR